MDGSTVPRRRSRWIRRAWGPLDVVVRLPPRVVAWGALALVVVGYGALAVVGVVFASASALEGLWSGLFVLALVALQLGYLSRPDRRPRAPWSWVALAGQAVLVFFPIVLFGPLWHGLPGMLAGSALLVLPRAAGLVVAALVVAAIGVVSAAGSSLFETVDAVTVATYAVTSALTSAFAVFGLSALARLVFEAYAAREEYRRVAVARERVRLARDVHDLLGQTLSGIALRGELIWRLAGRRTDLARAELTEVLVMSRRALVDVRRVVGIRQDLDKAGVTTGAAVPVPQLAPRVGSWMLVGVLGTLSAFVVVGISQDRGVAAGLVLGSVRAALIVGVLLAARAGRRIALSGRILLLVGMAVVAYGPQPFLGLYSYGGEVFVGGAALLLFRPAVGAGVAAVVCAAAVVIEFSVPSPSLAYSLAYAAVGSVLVTSMIFGLGLLARLVGEIHAARAEVGRVAVTQERMRVARDVHDLLGLGLSAITLKCELADRLLELAPERARAELVDILTMVQRASLDLRSVIGGERELSLEDEWRTVVATLETAAVDVRLSRPAVSPTGSSGTILATVLREAATNVLRHSAATWCEITLSRGTGSACLEVANDGVSSDREFTASGRSSVGDGGNGLQNMAHRIDALGGALEVGADGPIYRLRARVPTSP